MKIIDLTHCMSADMPVYPGTEGPKFTPTNSYEKDGFKETLLTMYSHTGTHMDPPAHLYAEGKTLDQFDASHFVGKALVIDCTSLKEGDRIGMELIDEKEASKAEYLLFNTGWDRYWGTDQYFGNYPYITDEVAQYIIDTKKKGVGLDTIGLDPVPDENLTLHRKVFRGNDMVIIENLTNLEAVRGGIFTFCCLPLKYADADGSPIRAIALLEE